LKLIFLIVTRAVSLVGLSQREEWWKDAEILMPRHQLAVAQRERPRPHSRLTWPDRAWLALLAGTMLTERLAAMRLPVTPGDASQGPVGRTAAGPGRTSRGDTAGSTVSSRDSASRWRRPRSGRSSRTLASARHRAGTAPAGRSSCGLRRRGSW